MVGRASRASLYRVLRCTQFMIGDRFEGESVAGGGVLGGLTSASSKPATTSSVWMSASNRISLISKQKREIVTFVENLKDRKTAKHSQSITTGQVSG